jgi:hypothetical protein
MRVARRLRIAVGQPLSVIAPSALPPGQLRNELVDLCGRIEAALASPKPPSSEYTLNLIQVFQQRMKGLGL